MMKRLRKRPFWFWLVIGLSILIGGYSIYFATLAAKNDIACLVRGYAHDAKACPFTLDNHLYIGSITKTFTAALVMQQVEADVIRLDDPIETWIAHPNGDQITVEMPLRHTSGLLSYIEDASFLLAYFGRPEKEWILKNCSRLFKGSRSIEQTTLLAALQEVVLLR